MGTKLPKVLIVIPCLNEQEALPGLLARLRSARDGLSSRFELDMVVIDDGSTDRTAAIARAEGVRVARLSRNLGIGGAVQTGLRLALRENCDLAVQMDGDGQHPPDELGKILEPMVADDPPDIVIGSRFLDAGGWRTTAMRRLGIAWLSFVLRVIARVKVRDATSGYRAYGRRALELFDAYYPYDYPEPESVALARATGLRVVEVAVKMQGRQGGASSIRGLATGYYMLKVTLAVLLTFARGRSQ